MCLPSTFCCKPLISHPRLARWPTVGSMLDNLVKSAPQFALLSCKTHSQWPFVVDLVLSKFSASNDVSRHTYTNNFVFHPFLWAHVPEKAAPLKGRCLPAISVSAGGFPPEVLCVGVLLTKMGNAKKQQMQLCKSMEKQWLFCFAHAEKFLCH